MLRLDGHEVKIASDGPSALQSAADYHPEVILLDIGLPEMVGYEVARRLRVMPGFAETILIALSGYDGEEHLDRVRQAGLDHNLVKPLNQVIASTHRQ